MQQPQQQQQQKRTRSSRPKLFQCKGFGDCNMVFTRSEHLARHSRKHTGEKPFVCVVPLCTKAFSRFDNMMQHTQTHRGNNNSHHNVITVATKNNNTTRTRAKRISHPLHITTTTTAPTTTKRISHPLHMTTEPTTTKHSRHHSSSSSSSSSSSDEEEDTINTPTIKRRRLSVADLCNPPQIHLTKDEFEALEGFGRFSSNVFTDSLKNLASKIHIEPSPSYQ